MFTLEMTGFRPPGAEPYYCVCVRDPITIGRLDNSDIRLESKDVSRQHATLTVHLADEVPVFTYHRKPHAPGTGLEEERSNNGRVGLSLTLTNYSKFGTTVNGELITGSCDVREGDTITFGGGINMKISYRPVVVAIAHHCYSSEYVSELKEMMKQTGAAVVDSPDAIASPDLNLGTEASPVAMFYCTEELDDHHDSLAALVFGFSAVVPSYVFEFFGSIADSPKTPLHQLPPPGDYPAAISRRAFPRFQYLRPEPDTCPFSLYPQPRNAVGVTRSRAALFAERKMYITDPAIRQQIGMFIAACGGRVKPAVERFDLSTTHVAPLSYLVLPDAEWESLKETNATQYPPHVAMAIKENYKVIPLRCIISAFLTNQFLIEPLEIEVEELPVSESEGVISPNQSFSAKLEGRGSFRGSFRGSLRALGSSGSMKEATKAIPSIFSQEKPHSHASFYSPKKAGSPTKGGDTLSAQGSSGEIVQGGVRPPEVLSERESVDSDATPSDLDPVDLAERAGLDDAASENDGYDGRGAYSSNPVLAAIDQLRVQMSRTITPSTVRVDDIYAAAKKNRYVATTSIAFLEDTYSKCESHLAQLEELSTSPEGNLKSGAVKKQWDQCVALQEKILLTMQLAASLGDRQAKRSRLLRNRNPHLMPPVADEPVSGGRSAGEDGSPDSSVRGSRIGKSASPGRAASASLSQHRQKPVGITDHYVEGIRQGTRIARYHPPPPVKARIHTVPPKKTTHETGDISNAKLNIRIPASAPEEIAKHRKLFIRKYGGPEGEIRFGMWFNGQSLEWISQFHKAIEERNMTIAELFSV